MIIKCSMLWWILGIFTGNVLCADSNDWQPNKGKDLEIILPSVYSAPVIDGALSDAVWSEAEEIGNFVEVFPEEGRKPSVDTRVFLMYDSENIYIGFVCYEDDISEIRATLASRDLFLPDDMVLIYLDTFNQLEMLYYFGVNPYGVQMEGTEQSGFGQPSDPTFDTRWESSAKIFDDRWEVEIKIPFSSLRFPRNRAQHWRVSFARSHPRETHRAFYSWPLITRDNPCRISQFGHLWIKEPLAQRGGIELLPYLVGFQTGGLINPKEPETFQNERPGATIGFSGKYRITSDLTLDFAMNPDFSQIETDAPRIDVNTTFALFYPERRPFFMEGREILASPINAIYTRSINDPIAALRLTGRLGRTSIGFITAYDEHTPYIVPFRDYSFPVTSDINSFSNILRIRQSILKDSYIGFLATSRDMKESYSRVAGFDGNVRFLKNYNITFQGLRSWNREPNDTSIFPGRECLQFDGYTSAFDGEKFDGTAYRIRFERTARLWSFTIWHNARSPTFRADNGFIRWNDVRNIGLWTRLDFEPHKWIFERITPLLSISRRYDYAGNFRKEFIHPGLSITFQRQTNASLSYSLSSEVFMGKKFDNIWTISGSLNTNFSKFISGGVWSQFGKGLNYWASPIALGDIRNISLWLTLNPTSGLSSSFTSQRFWLWESDGGEEVYDVTVFRNITSYHLTKHLSIRLITQYHSARKNIAIYPLLSYEPTPFTVFYLGSNHDLNEFNEPYSYRESNRHIFVKFQYLFDY